MSVFSFLIAIYYFYFLFPILCKPRVGGARAGVNLRGCFREFGWTPYLKKMRHFNTLAWPQNSRNPISEDLSFKSLLGGQRRGGGGNDPGLPYRRLPLAVCILNPLTKTLYLPKRNHNYLLLQIVTQTWCHCQILSGSSSGVQLQVAISQSRRSKKISQKMAPQSTVARHLCNNMLCLLPEGFCQGPSVNERK